MERSHVFALFVTVGLAACNDPEEEGGGTPDGVADADSKRPDAADDITQDGNPQHAEPTCHNLAACCPAGTVAVFGTALADEMSTSTAGRCQLSLGGADIVVDESESGLHAVLAGPGNDQVQGGFGTAILAGGADADTLKGRGSNDELYGQLGNDVLEGGPGNDRLFGGTEADTLVGGPGGDSVNGGPGNDHVYVHDLCEIATGDSMMGHDGSDTLHSPIPASQLGVIVGGFENFVVEASPEKSICAACGCEYVAGTGIVCCSGRGTCDVADEQRMVCDCDPGYAGDDCSYDPAETYFDDLPPACEEPGMACSATYEADDIVIEEFDLAATGECDDLTLLAEQPLVDLIVMHPSIEPDEWAPGQFPFVILGAGNGFDESRYDLLAEHFAREGFVVVLAAPTPLPPNFYQSGSVGVRGEELHCLRRVLPDLVPAPGQAPLGDHHDGRWQYAGHSRGGEATVLATSLDAQQFVSPPDAVIALAPTRLCTVDDPDPNCGYDNDAVAYARGALDDGQTPAFLVMQGSRDLDPDGHGVSLFDVAAKEHEHDNAGGLVTPPADAMVKAMKWVYDAQHCEWSDEPAPYVSFACDWTESSNGALLAETFGLAFLRWHVFGETQLRGLFTGTTTDACVADPSSCNLDLPPPIIASQYREPGPDFGGRRKVVRYFSEELVDPEGTGGPATTSGAVTQVEAGAGGTRANLRGLAVHLAASRQTPAWIELGLDGATPGIVTPIDAVAEGLSHLSLRLVRVVENDVLASASLAACDAAAAENDTPLSVRVTLEDADGAQAVVHTSDVTPVLPADIAWVLDPQSIGLDDYYCEAISFWTTVRIPLMAFNGVDRRALSSVRITVDARDHGNAAMEALLDSVELVGHELDGVCGDDVATGEEACDGTDLRGRGCADFSMVGTLACTPECTFDTSGCLDCEPGEPGCTCLDENVDGLHPLGPLPGGGSLGDGHYCADDVVFGGTQRCVEDGTAFRCEQCAMGHGVFCHCDPAAGCLDGSQQCHFACNASPCGEENTALQYGYCFVPGEEPEDGGVPTWFFDAYCDAFMDDFVCNYVDGDGNQCVDGPGDGTACVL